MRPILPLLFAAALCVAGTAFAADYGAPMPDGEAIDIATAAADPSAGAGEPALYRGRITQVCQKAGCWVVLEHGGRFARVMAKDHAFAVPKDAAGEAVVHGVLEVEDISAEHARHLVEDDGAAPPAERELRITATSIRLL